MSTKEKETTWLDIQDIVRDDFLRAVIDEEIVQLVKTFNLDIPGFSHRIDRAPIPMLKRELKGKLNKLPLEGFFKAIVADPYEAAKDKSYEEGIKQIASNQHLTSSNVVALLGILYPDKYMDLRRKFTNKLDQKENPLSSVVDLEMKDILPTLIHNHSDQVKKLSGNIKWDEIDFDPESLQDHFMTDYKLENKTAANIFLTDMVDELGINEEELAYLRELAIYELIQSNFEATVANESLKLEKTIQADAYKSLKLSKETLEKRFTKEQAEAQASFEKNIGEKDDTIEELTKKYDNQIDYLQGEQATYLQKIESLQRELKEAKQVDRYILDIYDKVTLFTDRTDEFNRYMNQTVLKTIKEIQSQLTGTGETDYFFVDVFGMSTAEKRTVKDTFREHNLRVRLLSDKPIQIVRKIIYTIEGVEVN